ncbi:MAG: hypothetical protein LBE80_02110, partial [Deltaproteobacteria bacterium]|nr:hypothetical protein [Deltaproteobacteria bacterium]
MTISKNPNTSKPLESQASPLVPSLEADPGGSQVGAISPALAPDPSGPSQKAVNPGAGLPQGLGTSLIGPFPPNENDPRLSLAAKDIKDLWPLSLNFYEAYHGQVGSEAPLAWPGPEAAREPNLSAHGPEPAGPTAEAPPAWPELAAPPGPYGEMAPKSTKYPLTAAPFDLSGAGPLMAALGLPQAEIPNLGAINQVVAESQFLPSW